MRGMELGRGFRWSCAVIALGLVAAACSDGSTPAGETRERIRILVSAPLTGDFAETGEDMVNGARLAAEHINENGGVSGGPMEGAELVIETADDQVSTEAAATIASRYVDDPGIWALTGMISSGQVQAAAQVAERANLVVYSTFSCADFLTTESSNVLILCTRLQSLGQGALHFTESEFDAKTVSALTPDFSFEDDIYAGVNQQAMDLGVTVHRHTYPFDQSDFSALLTNVERDAPDVIAQGDFQGNAGRIVSQARAAGMQQPIVDFLCEGWASTFYDVAGEAATEDVYACETSPRSYPDGTLGARVIQEWEQRYDKRMTSPAIHAYDTILAIEATIAAGASSREDLLELLDDIDGGEGLLGPIQFEGLRPVERPQYFLRVTGTTAEDVEQIAEYRLFADATARRVS